jgi:hypothetical protein
MMRPNSQDQQAKRKRLVTLMIKTKENILNNLEHFLVLHIGSGQASDVLYV